MIITTHRLLQVMAASIISIASVFAQVSKQVVVEHFSNTRCSVCASRNPGFYTNLNAQENVLHLAIHPSAPYNACVLNKHNTAENDARTNYYGIYGSTPRLVVQGNVISGSANYSSAAIFTPYLQQTSPFTIAAVINEYSVDSIVAVVVVKAVSTHAFTNLLLTTYAVEEQVNYTAPNGEQMHHDVFRKSFFEINGKAFLAPVNINDSIIFSAVIAQNSEWVFNKIYALAMVQEVANKQMVQAGRSTNLTMPTGINKNGLLESFVIPNPVVNQLQLKVSKPFLTNAKLYNIAGSQVLTEEFNYSTTLNLTKLKAGIYFLVLINGNETSTHKIIKLIE